MLRGPTWHALLDTVWSACFHVRVHGCMRAKQPCVMQYSYMPMQPPSAPKPQFCKVNTKCYAINLKLLAAPPVQLAALSSRHPPSWT
jgi:hypothetical protein